MKPTLRHGSVFVTTAYWIGILTATHLPPDRIPPLGSSDKSIHIVAYFVLTVLLHACLWIRDWSIIRAALMVGMIGLIYGAIDERTQPWFRRSADIRDWVADAAGVGIATILMVAIRAIARRRKDANSLTSA